MKKKNPIQLITYLNSISCKDTLCLNVLLLIRNSSSKTESKINIMPTPVVTQVLSIPWPSESVRFDIFKVSFSSFDI